MFLIGPVRDRRDAFPGFIQHTNLSIPLLQLHFKLHFRRNPFQKQIRGHAVSPDLRNLYGYLTESGSATAQKAGFGLHFPSNSSGLSWLRQLIWSFSPQTWTASKYSLYSARSFMMSA